MQKLCKVNPLLFDCLMTTLLQRHDIEDGLYVYLQDNSKRWYCRFVIDRKWITKSTKETDLDKAISKAYSIVVEHKIKAEHGINVLTKRFKDVALETIAKMKEELEHGGGKVIYKDYIQALNKYHIPYFDRIHITSIDQNKIREFNSWRIEQFGRIPAKSTILTHNAALQMVFKEAIEQKWMIAAQVPTLTNIGQEGKRRASFTMEEYDIVYDAVVEMMKESRKEKTRQIRELLTDYMDIALYTGMRPGSEMDNLTWSDIKIESHEHRVIFYITVRKGKTTKHTGTREIVCNQHIFDTIRTMARRFPDRKPTDKLFRLRDGATTKELGVNFDKALELCGLKASSHGTRSLYSIRHTYITLALTEQLFSVEVLAKQCGTSSQMIEQHYSHVIPRTYKKELSGINLDDNKQMIQSRFDVPKKTKRVFAKLIAEWEINYKRRGCI
ncbi:tyrosine-type recombinase/integrase [Catenovulum adriaticum]|uniref:Site-specific integrase n=1 Tax=Catenovulum adriaticum TaxID=2984846 RepID=A0ABY7AMJ4_9ALTE|nr:tyrosine-type recombinase/integrase [Catenovulum sp. TS8]WAJ69521.1 site-specific integrase [Catenovulum sp. TS8]